MYPYMSAIICIYVYAQNIPNTYLYIHTKKHKTFSLTRGLHEQLTPMRHSKTQNLELKKSKQPIKTVFTIKRVAELNLVI